MSTATSVGSEKSSAKKNGAHVEKTASAPHQTTKVARMRMPAQSTAEADAKVSTAIRLFHLVGVVDGLPPDPLAGKALVSAVAAAALAERKSTDAYPLLVAGSDIARLPSVLARAVEGATKDGGAPGVQRHLPHLARVISEVVALRGDHAQAAEISGELIEKFAATFDVSEKGARQLAEELARFKAQMPSSGDWVGFGENTLSQLHGRIIGLARSAARSAFGEEARALAMGLRQMLQADAANSPQATQAGSLAGSLGSMGSSLLDASAMAKTVSGGKGPSGLGERKRTRIEQACVELEKLVKEWDRLPAAIVLCTEGEGTAFNWARVSEQRSPLKDAIKFFDDEVARLEPVFRAMRLAKLALDGRYDPEVHDPLLARFDWRSSSPEELAAMPSVVVFETGEKLRKDGPAELWKVLGSRRPIQVIVADVAFSRSPDEGLRPGIASLASANREALVVQSTLADPDHLVAGLRRAASSTRPAVVVVGVPTFHSPVSAWLQVVAAHESRRWTCFSQDPSAGDTWAKRFDVTGNPQAERDWPVHSVGHLGADGSEQQMELALTWASWAAIDPAWRSSFRVLPASAWADNQIDVGEALAKDQGARPQAVPFVWVADETGQLHRAVLAYSVMQASQEAATEWRLTRELGGVHNSHAERAVAAALADTHAKNDAERAQLEAQKTSAVEEARATAASVAMDRLVAVLMNLDTAPLPTAGVTTVAAPAPAGANGKVAAPAPAAAAAAPAAAKEEEASFEEAYIDSMLCTTCNECTNINGRMFKYNGDKQATVADVKAGTFAELVKAAEKCPARCIHPGAPRAGDNTVTDALIAKAAEFR